MQGVEEVEGRDDEEAETEAGGVAGLVVLGEKAGAAEPEF